MALMTVTPDSLFDYVSFQTDVLIARGIDDNDIEFRVKQTVSSDMGPAGSFLALNHYGGFDTLVKVVKLITDMWYARQEGITTDERMRIMLESMRTISEIVPIMNESLDKARANLSEFNDYQQKFLMLKV